MAAYSTTNARKTGQSITIRNCERISEALASTCETSRHSFESDSANLSIFLQICFACTSHGMPCFSPMVKKKKGICKQRVNEYDKKVPYIVLKCNIKQSTPFYFCDCFANTLFWKPLCFSSPWDSNKIFHSSSKRSRFVRKR